MKNELSLKQKNYISSIFCGICWFTAGLTSHWDHVVCHVICFLALIGAIVAMIFTLITHAEAGDEMSDLNFLKAKARTYDSVLIIFLLVALIGTGIKSLIHEDIILNWQAWIMMFIGFMQFRAGIFFAKFEKDGD